MVWGNGLLGVLIGEGVGKNDMILVTRGADEASNVSLMDFLHADSDRAKDDDGEEVELVEIKIQVRTSSMAESTRVLAAVVDRLEDLLAGWPNLVFSRFIQHPRSLSARAPVIAQFEVDTLEKAILRGESEVGGVDVVTSVPDIALADFHGRRADFSSFSLHEQVGEGFFGKVHRATSKDSKDNMHYAVKLLTVNADDAEELTRAERTKVFRALRRELMMHAPLSHPNIVALHAVCLQPFALIFELVDGGNLYEFIHDRQGISSPSMAVSLALDLANAIDYLHNRKVPIVHLDIKSPNVLVQSKPTSNDDAGDLNVSTATVSLKLADFGTARFLDSGSLSGRHVENPIWLAPEIIRGAPYTEKVDVYAFGVICYELLTQTKYFGTQLLLNSLSSFCCLIISHFIFQATFPSWWM